jgi:hypothetical protein
MTQWTIYNCTSINCSSQIQIDQTVPTTFSELYIPARILSYGIYQLKLTVKMDISVNVLSSNSVYVKITPSGIIANLVQYGTSMITSGHDQDLILDPGTLSIDLDGYIFNTTVNSYHFYFFQIILCSFHRIGFMNIIVEFMVFIHFPTSTVHCYQSMIPE